MNEPYNRVSAGNEALKGAAIGLGTGAAFMGLSAGEYYVRTERNLFKDSFQNYGKGKTAAVIGGAGLLFGGGGAAMSAFRNRDRS